MHVINSPYDNLPRPGRVRLVLRDSKRESPSIMTFRFSPEGSAFRYVCQQAVRLALPDVEDPWGPARTFSLSSSPTEEDILTVTCKISDTPFKQALSRRKPGDPAEAYGPLGAFLFQANRPALMMAGGIGITPFRGMLRFASDTGTRQPIALLYSARTPEELVFAPELDAIAEGHSNIRVYYTVTRPQDSKQGWAGRVGRIDEAWIRVHVRGLDRPMYYVAGLPEMVESVVTTLRDRLGVSEEDIDYEVFRGF